MPDGAQFVRNPTPRNLPSDMAERLIVALDVESVESARALVRVLDGTVSFFKIGLWLFLQPHVNQLIDELVASRKKVFLDYKMFDISETVRRGVESAVSRGITFLTVHGDAEIMKAAVDGRADSDLKVFAISVLTSLNDSDLKSMGYGLSVRELIELRVRNAVNIGCDGIIASPNDKPDELRTLVNDDNLLIATPGVRMDGDSVDDHARAGTPADAIFNGADYLVVGRPIIRDGDPLAKARSIIEDMRRGHEKRSLLPT
jgi:orotidine-5'-phosphate decarboxylase